MKKLLIPIVATLGFVVVLAMAKTTQPAKPPEVKCECTCPTLDQLIKEKEAAEKAARDELGRERRQILKDKLSPFFNP